MDRTPRRLTQGGEDVPLPGLEPEGEVRGSEPSYAIMDEVKKWPNFPPLAPYQHALQEGWTFDRSGFHRWVLLYLGEAAQTVEAKAKAYGSNSLAEMGRVFARAQEREVDDATALELGCYLYAYGKMQRVSDGILRGEAPAQDSWHDLVIYGLMALYIREHGRWP